MSMRNIAVWIGITAYAVAWFLPVVSADTLIADVSGWNAFWIALSALWHPRDQRAWETVVLVASALTNVPMVIAFVRIVGRRPVSIRWAQTLIVAGILDTSCLLLFEGDLRHIGVGYWVWWLSFFVVGGGLLLRPSRAAESDKTTVIA